jgi:hypothetical protein
VPIGRRLSILTIVLVLVGTPAVILRTLCVGHSCDDAGTEARATVPFCSLPLPLRRSIAAGFWAGRSPDVMAATAGIHSVRTGFERTWVAWPGSREGGATNIMPDTRVPMALFGIGVAHRAMPDGVRLDAIAPTLEEIVGVRRKHTWVRTGTPIDGAAVASADAPRLVVLIAWKGLGTPDLEADPAAWQFLDRSIRIGSGTTEAVTGSLPLDPAATLTTIGTGALPSSHGITGTLIRNQQGDLQTAWTSRGAGSLIATLADDLDHLERGQPRIAAVIGDPADRGIIGDGWYLGRDRDAVAMIGSQHRSVAELSRSLVMSEGLGRDDVTDALGVVLDGSLAEVDRETADVVTSIRDLVPDTTFAVAGTGSNQHVGGADASMLKAYIDGAVDAPVIEGVGADGLFLDQRVLADRDLTGQRVADELRRLRLGGKALFADVYPSFAVELSRFC